MKLARDPTKQFAIVPFHSNIVYNDTYRCIFILSGQLNAAKDKIAEGGIGRRIVLFPNKDE